MKKSELKKRIKELEDQKKYNRGKLREAYSCLKEENKRLIAQERELKASQEYFIKAKNITSRRLEAATKRCKEAEACCSKPEPKEKHLSSLSIIAIVFVLVMIVFAAIKVSEL